MQEPSALTCRTIESCSNGCGGKKRKKSDLSHLNGFGGFEISALGCFDCLLL